MNKKINLYIRLKGESIYVFAFVFGAVNFLAPFFPVFFFHNPGNSRQRSASAERDDISGILSQVFKCINLVLGNGRPLYEAHQKRPFVFSFLPQSPIGNINQLLQYQKLFSKRDKLYLAPFAVGKIIYCYFWFHV